MTREEVEARLSEGQKLQSSDPKHARLVLQSLITECRRNHIDLLASVLCDYAHVNFDEAENIRILEEARDLADRFGDKLLFAKTLSRLGMCTSERGNLKEGIALMEKSFTLLRDPDVVVPKSDATALSLACNLVIDYQTLGAIEQVSKYRAIILELFPQVERARPKAWALGTLANSVALGGEPLSAIPIYEACLKFAEEARDLSARSEFLGKLGLANTLGGRPQAAERALVESIEIARKIEEPYAIAVGLRRYGNYLRNAGRIEEAEVCLSEAPSYLEGHPRTAVQVKFELAEIYLQRKDFTRAKQLLIEIEHKFLEMGVLSDMPEVYRALSELYTALNDIPQAFDYLKKMFALREELFSAEAKRSMSSVQILLAIETEKHQTEIHRLKAERIERELATATLSLLAQTELLANFRDDLRSIVRRIAPTEPAIRELKEKLKELPCTSVDWPKFEAQFLTVHPEFKQKLVQKYPELSPAEIRICILLRLDLKSHEIARLTCLSERSVEDHRYQIRKKLGVKKGEFVLDYVSKL